MKGWGEMEIKKAIELLKVDKDIVIEAGEKEEFNIGSLQEFNLAISALEKQLNGGWVPCKERLPEKYGSYLVAWRPVMFTGEDIKEKTRTNTTHCYEILEFDPDDEAGWIEEIEQCSGQYYILAWRELPEPYKEEIK